VHAPTPDLARLNRQGLMHLQRLAGNASVSALISSDVPVQRFLAIGPTTHETIEEPGLAAAGLTQQQIEMVDLGNWMRDLSQLQMAPIGTTGGKAAFEVISILARGLFDKDITPAELGGYLPAEHLDRPEQKVKDPKEPVPPSTLSDEQKKWEALEQTAGFKDAIKKNADESSLPTYIETGKEHARRRLGDALDGGPQGGLLAFGDALHTMQDYYSHSNFLEVTLTMLHSEGSLADPVWRQLAYFWLTQQGLHLADIGLGLPQVMGGAKADIVTGTYTKETAAASTWENIELGIKIGGSLQNAFLLGWMRKYGLPGVASAKASGASAGGSVGKTIGGTAGATKGAITEGASGAASGAQAGWQKGQGVVDSAEKALSGALSQGKKGAAHGGSAGWQSGSAAGQQTGTQLGGKAGEAVGTAKAGIQFELIREASNALLNTARLGIINKKLHAKAEANQKAAIEASDPNVPTHAQLAKDDPNHPLIPTAGALTQAITRAAGDRMQAAWKNPNRAAARQDVARLVDEYVSHPASNPWWRSVLQQEIPPLTARLQALKMPEMSRAELQFLQGRQQR